MERMGDTRMDGVTRYSVPDTTASKLPPGDTAIILRRAIETAKSAPSGHNMQPWRFRLGDGHMDVFADRTRALPVIDPDGRELTISCGVAVFYLRLALRHAGFGERATLLPDTSNPDWFARVWIEDLKNHTFEDSRLFEAIPRRRTNRLSFYSRLLPEEFSAELSSIARKEGISLHPVPPESREPLIRLVAQGAQELANSVPFREEFLFWSENAADTFDPETGVTNFPGDVGRHLAYAGTLTSLQNPAILLAAQESRLAHEAPLIVTLSSPADTPLAWLTTGQALAHILLYAASTGVMAAYLNTPVQVKSLRSQVAQLIGTDAYPQVILALGHAPYGQRTPRRNIEDVLW